MRSAAKDIDAYIELQSENANLEKAQLKIKGKK
jgi:hypothetical protein